MAQRQWFLTRQRRCSEVDQELEVLLDIKHDLLDLAENYAGHRRTYQGRQLIATLLFFRLIEASEAVVFLCRYGLEGEAAVVSRSQLEILVNLVLCSDEDGYCEKYMAAQRIPQKKQATALARSTNPLLSEWKEFWNSALEGLTETGEPAPLGSFEDRCTRAGLKDYYDVVYRSHSVDAHAQPISLMRHVVVQSGEPTSIGLLPDLKHADPGRLLYLSAELLLRGIYSFLQVLGVLGSDRVEELKTRLEEYGELAAEASLSPRVTPRAGPTYR